MLHFKLLLLKSGKLMFYFPEKTMNLIYRENRNFQCVLCPQRPGWELQLRGLPSHWV